jgi:UDP-glucose 4-epimerase
MRIVVTGGAGYIGSVVTEQLIGAGHDVLVIDDLSRGHRDAVVEPARLACIDLRKRLPVARALAGFGADAVVHMAASSLVGESVTSPSAYYHNNVIAGVALLDAMRDASVGRIVFSSTAAVYGEPEKQPIEETDRTAPTNPYGETKLALERALRWYVQAYGMSAISLRYFNAAGATDTHGERHEPETHLIPLVLEAAAGLRAHVTVFGDDYPTKDGTCVRDYIHVSDLARAHTRALEAMDGPGICRAYNLGCGGGYSVRDVVDSAERVTGRRIPVQVVARRPGDPAVLVARSDRIGRELGWRPQHQQLDAIIASAWRWMMRDVSPARQAPRLEPGPRRRGAHAGHR